MTSPDRLRVRQSCYSERHCPKAKSFEPAPAQRIIDANRFSVVTFYFGVDGILKDTNPAGLEKFGYQLADVGNITIFDLVCSEDAQRARFNFLQTIKEKIPSINEYWMKTRHGVKVYIQIHTVPDIKNGVVVGLQGIAIDFSERKRSEIKRLKLEQDIQRKDNLFEKMVNLFPDGIVIHKNGTIVFMNAAGLAMIGATSLSEVIGRSVSNFVPKSKKAESLRRIQTLNQGGPNSTSPSYVQTLIPLEGDLIEIEVRGQVVDFNGSPAVQFIFRNVSQQIKAEQELQAAYEATIEGWGMALDLRDKETEGHSQRVIELTLRLASAMGVTGDELTNIRRGATLHDIGKMGIPDSILFKPSPLTADEEEIIHKHPYLAYTMLVRNRYLRESLAIPYYHHERWDGTGYPNNLAGETIPLAARIFAVVDVWDALTSDRPYRRAWLKKAAIEHIKKESGKHFDPKVVENFLEIIQK